MWIGARELWGEVRWDSDLYERITSLNRQSAGTSMKGSEHHRNIFSICHAPAPASVPAPVPACLPCRCASKWLIKTFLHITSISTLNLMAGSTGTHTHTPAPGWDGSRHARSADPTTSRIHSLSRITSSSSSNNNKHRNSNGNTSRNMLLTLHSGLQTVFCVAILFLVICLECFLSIIFYKYMVCIFSKIHK